MRLINLSGGSDQLHYYRVAGAQVVVPPLRDRMDDLPILVQHFMEQQTPPRAIGEVPAEVWEVFRTYRWPGNVRELRKAVQRMVVRPERVLRGAPRPAEVGRPSPAVDLFDDRVVPLRIARRESRNAFEKEYVHALFKKAGGSITRAASMAEVSRQIMWKLVRKHGLH